jgi:hypothetical protein
MADLLDEKAGDLEVVDFAPRFSFSELLSSKSNELGSKLDLARSVTDIAGLTSAGIPAESTELGPNRTVRLEYRAVIG